MEENLKILDSFKNLEDIDISYDTIELTKNFIRKLSIQPEVFVTPNDSIQLEYADGDNRHLNIEIFDDKMVIFEMFENRKSIEDIYPIDFEIMISRINEFIKRRL